MEKTVRDPYHDIEKRLARLRPVQSRDSQHFRQGREAFLAQARQLKAQGYSRLDNAVPAGVSSRKQGHLIGQIYHSISLTISDLFRAKERPAMIAPIMTVLVVIMLLFGSAGATAYAAQDSLPDDALYPVKTLTEDVQLGLSARDQNRLDLELTFAERRVSEMAALARLGIDTPVSVANRMGAKVEAALTIAAGLEGEAQQEALGQILTRMETQEQVLAGLEASNPGDGVLAQARQRLQAQIRLAADAMSDPAGLQQHLRQRAQTRAWEVQEPAGPGFGGGNENGNGNANGNSNPNANVNGNANQNGNGDCDGANCNANDNGGMNANDNNANSNDANMNGGNHNGDDDNENGNDDANANGNENGNDDDGNGNDANMNGGNHNSDDDNNDGGEDANADGNENGDSGGNDNGGSHGGDNDNGGEDGGHHGGDNDNGGSDGNENGGSGGSGGSGGGHSSLGGMDLALSGLAIIF